jgi:hypothetical protein
MVVGHLLFYLNYKLKVVEPKWVEKYGTDVAHKRKLWLAHQV